MRLLVTGHTGQLAKSLANRAGFFGADISHTTNTKAETSESYEHEIRLHKPDIVVNCATIGWREYAENNECEFFKSQISEATNIAIASANLKLPLIHISCHHVFDGKSDYPYTEKSQPSGTSEIGRAVIQAEDAIVNHNPNSVILRTSWLYSESGDNILTRFISILKNAKAGMPINVPKAYFGSPTSTDDIADGILEVCNNLISTPHESELRGIFNMANHGMVSAAAFAKFLASFFDVPMDNIKETSISDINRPEQDFIGEISENAVYDCNKLLYTHGVILGDWRQALIKVLSKMQLANHIPTQNANANNADERT